MKIKSAFFAPVFAAAMAFASASSNAAIYESFLEYTQVGAYGPTDGTSPDGIPKLLTPAGLVTVTEGGFNGSYHTYLDVKVQLATGFSFIHVGAHELFSFNLNHPSQVTISFVEPSKFQVITGSPGHNPPFGPTFSNAITCAPAYLYCVNYSRL